MDLLQDFITRISENRQSNLLLCDSDFQIVAASQKLRQNIPLISEGGGLDKLFLGHPGEYVEACQELRKGIPVFSTKFELIRNFHVACLFPMIKDGHLIGVVASFDDAVANSSEASELHSFLPAVSDRYRAPISNILNILSMLAAKYQASEDYQGLDYLNEAAKYCYEMLRSSTMVHDYFLLVNHQMDFHPQRILLNDFLSELFDNVRIVLRNTQYQLEKDICKESLIAEADTRLLTLALFHLLVNACSFSPRDSKITLSLSYRNNTAFITVADEGVGIEQCEMEKLFLPFYVKWDTPVPEEQMGVGLGLPIVKEIASLHNANVYVTSERNRGTRVAFRLPLSENKPSGLPLHSNSAQYVTNRFSDLYILFSEVCDIKIY